MEAGSDICAVQELFVHTDVSTTMIFIHVVNGPSLPLLVDSAGRL
ncbi:MAG: hypothetical protein DRQ61_09290 [Gammaproteobacteria bacterium]|nr:MAG: hypothetical protein DRQ56_07380 [Gammaproteobacteria bacterium]RLA20903.1 MAG: hypothetical protein DRQ61_09290 [Gammaproteobacteria bacterium]